MLIDEDKETKDEESELDEDEIEDTKKLENTKLSEIEELKGQKGVKFNKDICVECNLLEKTEELLLYSNLYPIEFTKDIEIYEYPFEITPECHEESAILKILR